MKNIAKYSKALTALCAVMLFTAPVLSRAGGNGNLSDSQIERDVKKNMPSALSGRVSVTSNDGFITLTGSVISDAQKGWAESAAKQVPQVRGVDDRLRVENNGTMYNHDDRVATSSDDSRSHSDKWIALKVKSALAFHKNVSASHTDVNVVDGMVTLSGTADNSAQRELTEEYAKQVEGVRGVRNEIQIRDTNTTFAGDSRYNNGDDRTGYTTGERTDDSAITAKVKMQLAGHSSTSAIHTHVKTQNGVVYITGSARNDAEKDLVTKIARDIPGVSSVENDMSIGDR